MVRHALVGTTGKHGPLTREDVARVRPPLRWAGSKRSVLPLLAEYAPKKYGRYIEPFAGSAALFFFLRPESAILGDINQDLVAFYRVLAHRPHALGNVISRLDPSGRDYYALRDLSPTELFTTSAAARFLYLNRFCFNGVYRTNQKGSFNVPRGTKTGRLPTGNELHNAATVLRSATVQAQDFESTIAAATKGDFIYVDPPYFTRHGIKPGEYGYNSMGGTDDLTRLVSALNDLSGKGVKYMLSYSRSPRLVRLLKNKWVRHLSVRRSVGGSSTTRVFAREILVTNYRPPIA